MNKTKQIKVILIKIRQILCLWKNIFIFVSFLKKFIENHNINKNNPIYSGIQINRSSNPSIPLPLLVNNIKTVAIITKVSKIILMINKVLHSHGILFLITPQSFINKQEHPMNNDKPAKRWKSDDKLSTGKSIYHKIKKMNQITVKIIGNSDKIFALFLGVTISLCISFSSIIFILIRIKSLKYSLFVVICKFFWVYFLLQYQ